MARTVGVPTFQDEIACPQLCGLGYYRMRGFVTVLTAEEFQKWTAARHILMSRGCGQRRV